MSKPSLNRTDSSTSIDPKLARARQIRRDNDTTRTPAVRLEDIDYAIYYYLSKQIAPTILDGENTIPVPVMFSNGETWSQVKRNGFIRDRDGKQITPLITITRTGFNERDDIRKLDINSPVEGNYLSLRTSHNISNQYDRFSVVNNMKPAAEIYTLAIPEYISLNYTLNIWTEYTPQMNSIIELIQPAGGYAWGDTWKFITFIRDVSHETINTGTEDRIVRSTYTLDVRGYLITPYEYRTANIQKAFGIKRITWGNEFETTLSDIENPPGGYEQTGKFKSIHRRFG